MTPTKKVLLYKLMIRSHFTYVQSTSLRQSNDLINKLHGDL